MCPSGHTTFEVNRFMALARDTVRNGVPSGLPDIFDQLKKVHNPKWPKT